MKYSFALLLLLGFGYLSVLESVGNFITQNLADFQRSLKEHSDISPLASSHDTLRILRTPTDLLLEQERKRFSEEEKDYIKNQIVSFEYLLNGTTSSGIFAKIDKEMFLYDNFYKKTVYDVIMKRDGKVATN